MQGLGGTGAQQSKDCSFEAGSVAGAPLRISWFLVIFFVYQLIDAVNAKGLPVWVRVVVATGNEFLLLLTVLCHEMGHGTMARKRGGQIAEVLLWPFGGICFTTRAGGRAPKEKLVDDLLIVSAGPATHFPMAALWCALLAMFAAACGEIAMAPAWHHLVPFSRVNSPCTDFSGYNSHCFQTWSGYLTYGFIVHAIQLNVILFMFNVFFPMYPMDGAKLIVCTLQLFCSTSARCAARVLVYTSIPLSVLFIGNSLLGLGGGSLQPGITAYMGFMCLTESYKIYKLMREDRLHTHPLFELAAAQDRARAAKDEEEAATPKAPQVPFAEVKPFAGSGRPLGARASDDATPSGGGAGRAAWLERLEQDQAHRAKTVRELEEERSAAQDRERLVR